MVAASYALFEMKSQRENKLDECSAFCFQNKKEKLDRQILSSSVTLTKRHQHHRASTNQATTALHEVCRRIEIDPCAICTGNLQLRFKLSWIDCDFVFLCDRCVFVCLIL